MKIYIVIDQFGKSHQVAAELCVYMTVDTNKETLTLYTKEVTVGFFINPNAFYQQ